MAISSGLNFYTISQTLIECRAMQLIFSKVGVLLNNAFKIIKDKTLKTYHNINIQGMGILYFRATKGKHI